MRVKVTTEKLVCKNCGSPRIVKHGSYKGKQWWLCRDCGKAWTDNQAVPGGRLPADCLLYALGAYYDGQSIYAIRRNLKDQYGVCPSTATIFEWITKYTKKLIAETKACKPQVGSVWVADESYIRIDRRKDDKEQTYNPYDKSRKGKWLVFWDIIDAKTRYLIASLVTTTRDTEDARKLMELAYERTGKAPRVIFTDKLKAYIDGIEQAFGADTTHRQGSPFDVINNTNLIERLHGSLKSRTKVMRGLYSPESTKLFTDGWTAFYNFIRPHMTLGKTPAQAAGINYPFTNWHDFIGIPKPTCLSTEIAKGTPKLTPSHHAAKRRRPKKGGKTHKKEIFTSGIYIGTARQ